jgi:hypothetical protein
VPDQQVADAGTVKSVVEWKNSAARETKKHVNFLALQTLQQDFGTRKKLPHILLSAARWIE